MPHNSRLTEDDLLLSRLESDLMITEITKYFPASGIVHLPVGYDDFFDEERVHQLFITFDSVSRVLKIDGAVASPETHAPHELQPILHAIRQLHSHP